MDAVALLGIGLPSSGTPIVLLGNSHEGTASLATPYIGHFLVLDDNTDNLPTVPFGYGPYMQPKHQVAPSDGWNLEAFFGAVEDSPQHEDLFATLDQDNMHQENAA